MKYTFYGMTMADPRVSIPLWIAYEQGRKDGDGNYSWPFTKEIRKSGKVPVQVIKKMQLVQDQGWPEAKDNVRGPRGEKAVVPKGDLIWLLKCKPLCWRIYFYVRQEEKRFVYVHAVCKQADEEDPESARKAQRIAERGGPIRVIDCLTR